MIHYIVALQMKFPDKRIFLTKYDYSDAYRQIVHASLAAKPVVGV
jgi:hypothetical protein